MKKNSPSISPLLAILIALGVPALTSAQDAAAPTAFETVPPKPAAELVPQEMLTGPNYGLRAEAAPYLFDYTYTIDTEFGTFTAHGIDRLAKRINEINAIAALREMKNTETFSKAAAKAALSPLNTAKDLVTKPVKTAGGVLKGIVKTGKSVIGGVKDGVKSVAAGEKQQKTEFEDGALGELSGYSKMKRALAGELGVDPYSRNRALQAELKEVSRTAALGDLGVGTALTLFTGGLAGTAIQVGSTSAGFREDLLDMSPAEIRAMNRKKMEAFDCSDEIIDTFQNHLQFLPTEQALLVEIATRFDGAEGIPALFELASQTRDEIDTLLLIKSTAQLAKIHEGGTQLSHLVNGNGLMAGITADGRMIVPVPGGHIAWTPLADRIARAVLAFRPGDPAIAQRELLISGGVSPTARGAFAARGLAIRPMENGADSHQ